MNLSITLDDLDSLKRHLFALIPQAQSSHRTEALARGLGFGSNAAMRASLAEAPADCEVDDRAFVDFLKSRDVTNVPGDTLSEAVVRAKLADQRAAIAAVMEQQSELGSCGFRTWNRRRTQKENADHFHADREEMLKPSSIAEFMRAVAYLQTKEKSRRVSRKSTSYGYKHEAERFHKDRASDADHYVANGLFIVAALHLGFSVKRDGDSPNAFINIASPPVRRDRSSLAGILRGSRKLIAWRNMMVAGINAGLEQGVFGLQPGDNRWEGDDAIYRFAFGGLPAIACVRDIGYGELSVHVAIEPTAHAERHIRAVNAGFVAGEGFASGWLERESGAWLQTSRTPMGSIRNALLDRVADARPAPRGYADSGRVMI